MTAPPPPLLRQTQALFHVLFFFLTTSIYLFVSLPHSRGRTRGRVVVDEEDSMDGTEITESIGPQDTGETLQSPFLIHYVHVGYVGSDIRLELAHPGSLMQRVLQKGISLKVEESPSPGEGWMRAFSWHPMLLLQGYNWKGLAWAVKLQWVCIFFPPLTASISPPAPRLALRCSGKEPKANAL